jgi:hypothetical protein
MSALRTFLAIEVGEASSPATVERQEACVVE